jgi:hypothetical protein
MFVHMVSRKLILLVFAFFYLVNVLASGGHIDSWDGVESFLTTETMALKHTAKLDPTVPSQEHLRFNVNFIAAVYKYLAEGKALDPNAPLEPFYGTRPMLVSTVALPFYMLALALSVSPYVLVSMFTNSLLIALTSVVIFCFALELYRSAKIGFALGIIFNLCSFVLPYVTTLWAQPLQALTLVASLFFYPQVSSQYPNFYVQTFCVSKEGSNHTGDSRWAGNSKVWQ